MSCFAGRMSATWRRRAPTSPRRSPRAPLGHPGRPPRPRRGRRDAAPCSPPTTSSRTASRVQRRSAGDFDAAIVDGRLFRHLAALTATYPAVTLLVVGRPTTLLSEESRRGALAWVARQGVAVIRARGCGGRRRVAAHARRAGGARAAERAAAARRPQAGRPGRAARGPRRHAARHRTGLRAPAARAVRVAGRPRRRERARAARRARHRARAGAHARALFGHAYRGVVPEAAPTLWAAAS